MKIFLISLLAIGLSLSNVYSQSPIGQWKTIDDETGKEKSVVEFYEKGGKIYGKIVKILDNPTNDPNPLCEECDPKDDRYRKPIKGMEIIRNLAKNGSEWANGTVLDPENGKVYDCKIWLEGTDMLKLRGYVAFFFRTQTWYRVK